MQTETFCLIQYWPPCRCGDTVGKKLTQRRSTCCWIGYRTTVEAAACTVPLSPVEAAACTAPLSPRHDCLCVHSQERHAQSLKKWSFTRPLEKTQTWEQAQYMLRSRRSKGTITRKDQEAPEEISVELKYCTPCSSPQTPWQKLGKNVEELQEAPNPAKHWQEVLQALMPTPEGKRLRPRASQSRLQLHSHLLSTSRGKRADDTISTGAVASPRCAMHWHCGIHTPSHCRTRKCAKCWHWHT